MCQLISIVLPVYNGATTIGETLGSVRSQTMSNIEIIVVDDGSADGTHEIVLRHAREDPRVRLVRQPNAGVASARNRGIDEARSELVAPIDADDLWAPDKLRKQLLVLNRGGERVGLVYTWSAIIDETSAIIETQPGPIEEGDVAERFLAVGNFIGNGSAVLMRKSAVLEAGGYDPSLRARAAEGGEDFLLYFRIARNWRFAVVPEHLTLYRWRRRSMSSNARQMLRSWEIVMSEVSRHQPPTGSQYSVDVSHFLVWLYWRALRSGRIGDAAFVAMRLARVRPRRAAALIARTLLPVAFRARA